MILIGLLQTTSWIKMWKKQCWIVTTMCVLFELIDAQGNINYSRENSALPIHGIPAPRPVPSEVQVLEVPTTAPAAIVTESPSVTTLAPTMTTRSPGRLPIMAAPRPQPYWQHRLPNPQTTTLSPKSYDPGYFVSRDQLTGDTEVVSSTEPAINSEQYDPGYFVSKDQLTGDTEVESSTEPAINSEPYDPGYFVSKDQLTGDTEVVSSTAPAINSEPYDPGYFVSKDQLTGDTEVVSSTEPSINSEGYLMPKEQLSGNTEDISSTERAPEIVTEVIPEKVVSISTELPVPLEQPASTEPPKQKPIVWNMSTSRPFSRPLMVRPTKPIQRPIMGRTPIIEGEEMDVADDDVSKVDEAELIPLSKPTPKPVTSYENGHNFEILDKNDNRYPLATTTNIAIYQGPSTMTCTEADAYYTLENECDTFVECRRKVATIYMCPDGLFFNNKTMWPHYPCGYPSEVQCLGTKHEPKSSEECPRQYGFFPLPGGGDCGKYLMCQEGKATIMDCPPGLAFNPEKDGCDWPINVPSCEPDVLKGFDCPEPQRNEDGSPSDEITHMSFHNYCKQYIACQLGHPRLLSCDLGYSYDPRLDYCARTEDVPGCNDV